MDKQDSLVAAKPKNGASGKIGKTRYLLSGGDQVAIAAILVLCVFGMVFYFWHRSVVENGLIDIDRAERLHADYRVNINNSPWTAIANLPGIGEKLAHAIVDYREQHGPFRQASELVEVSGIGESKLRDIMPYLTPLESTDPE